MKMGRKAAVAGAVICLAMAHRRDHGDRPSDPGGHCDLSGRRGEGHLRDHCGSGSAGRPSDHPGGGSGAGAG